MYASSFFINFLTFFISFTFLASNGFLGHRYLHRSGDRSVMLLFDAQGTIAGIQTSVSVRKHFVSLIIFLPFFFFYLLFLFLVTFFLINALLACFRFLSLPEFRMKGWRPSTTCIWMKARIQPSPLISLNQVSDCEVFSKTFLVNFMRTIMRRHYELIMFSFRF